MVLSILIFHLDAGYLIGPKCVIKIKRAEKTEVALFYSWKVPLPFYQHRTQKAPSSLSSVLQQPEPPLRPPLPTAQPEKQHLAKKPMAVNSPEAAWPTPCSAASTL